MLEGATALLERQDKSADSLTTKVVGNHKKERHPHGCLSFLERRFCCAKSVACGRVIERARETRQRFPLHTFPSLRYAGVRTIKPVGDHKTPSEGMGFCFWNAAGGVEPRPYTPPTDGRCVSIRADVPQGYLFRFAPLRRHPPLRTVFRWSFRRGRCLHRPAAPAGAASPPSAREVSWPSAMTEGEICHGSAVASS